MTLSSLASNIRHLRKQLSLSQEELAKKLELKRGNIASYETGTAEPKICNLLNLAHFYKVPVNDLITVDLHCPVALKTAKENYQYELKEEDKVKLDEFIKQAEELRIVMKSLKVCHQYQIKNVSEMPAELQSLVSNFNQLCNAGGHLMEVHEELLEFVKSRMK